MQIGIYIHLLGSIIFGSLNEQCIFIVVSFQSLLDSE